VIDGASGSRVVVVYRTRRDDGHMRHSTFDREMLNFGPNALNLEFTSGSLNSDDRSPPLRPSGPMVLKVRLHLRLRLFEGQTGPLGRGGCLSVPSLNSHGFHLLRGRGHVLNTSKRSLISNRDS
jgi:hypothetical protein